MSPQLSPPIRTAIALFSLVALLPRTLAQTWNGGAADSNFSSAANWSGGVAPVNNGTGAVRLAGLTRQTPVLDTNYALDSLTVNQSGFTLGGNGVLTLGSNLLMTVGGTFNASVPIVLTGNSTFGGSTGGSMALSGPISGAGSLTWDAAGGFASLTLSGDNTFAGPLRVSSGSVYVGTLGTIGSNGTLTSDVVLSGNGGFGFRRTGEITFSQLISGNSTSGSAFSVAGGTGAGQGLTVTLNRQQTYTGGTSLGAVLVIAVENALPTSTTLTFSSFGTLRLGANQTVGSTSGGTGGRLDTGAGYVFTANLTQNSSISGTLGSGQVVLNGAYDQVMNDNWAHTGGTTLNGTNLILGTTSVARTVAGDITNNGRVTFNNTVSVTHAGNMTGTGSIRKLGTNTVTLTGNLQLGGGVIVDGGTLQIGSGTMGALSGNAVVATGANLTFSRNDALTYEGVVSGQGSLRKAGSGVLTLTGPNSHTGGTFLTAGTVAISSTSPLGSGDVTFSGGTLRTDAALGTITQNLIFSNSGTVNTNGFDSTVSGALSGSGTFTKSGSGTLTLLGAGTHSGFLTVSAGRLVVGADGVLAAGTRATLSSGATLEVAGNQSFVSFSSPSGATVQINAGKTLTFAPTSAASLGATLAGAGRMLKTGSQKATLSNAVANSFAGTMEVAGGTLRVSGNYGSADVLVQSGAALRATGSLDSVSILAGGNLSAGDDLFAGSATFNALSLAGGSIWRVDIANAATSAGTGWDLLTISGAFDFGGTAGSPVVLGVHSLSLNGVAGSAPSFVAGSDFSWRIATAAGGITGFSTAGVQLDTSAFANSFTGAFSVAQVGNELFLNYTAAAIPEPAAVACCFGLAALGLVVWRRRSRQSAARHW